MDRNSENDRHLADLMRSAQKADSAAYAQLLREVIPLLRRIVRHQYGFLQQCDIEDIVQEILLALHSARATYDPERPFLPWLSAIARNRTADAARRHARRSAREALVDTPPETFSDLGTNIPADAFGDPEALRQAIRHLPHGQRKAVELLKLREMSLREASVASGISMGALKVAVHRAMRTLRIMLSNKG